MQGLVNILLKYRVLTALTAGGISALGFAPWGLWPLTLLGTGILLWLTARATSKGWAFFTGWLFGVGQFCWGLQWIAVSFTYQAAMPTWIGYLSVFLLSLYLAVYPGIAAFGACWVLQANSRIKPASVYVFVASFAGFWIITEWLRSWVFTGFAWNPLSVTALGSPIAASTPTIGTYGASGLMIAASAIFIGLLAAILQKHWRLTVERIFNGMMLIAAAWVIGWMGSGALLPDDSDSPTATVVQPNITQEERNDSSLAAANIAKLMQQSVRLPGNDGRRLLLWPESAIPWYLEEGYPFRFYQFQPGENALAARAAVAGLLAPGDVLVTGNDRLIIEDGQLVGAHNSVTAMDANGALLEWYDKAHLVPYGEYLALRWLLEPLGATRLVPGSIDFWPGPGPRSMSLGEGLPDIGVQICYEIIFSGQVTHRKKRPRFIFNPSNDAWFGQVGPPQHLAQARLRAIEEGLPVIRSTPTGVSAIIDADGRVVKSLALGQAGRIDAPIPPARAPSWFAKAGNALPVCFALLLIIIALIPVARGKWHR